jgi:GntR family transcriptional regulator / MocR family aminotransferase
VGSTRSGSDFLHLDLDEAPRGGRAEWLASRIRSAILDGRLGTGARLPATRALCADLGVSRGVVTEAYRRLADDGLIAGGGRRGTVVISGFAVTTATATGGIGTPTPTSATGTHTGAAGRPVGRRGSTAVPADGPGSARHDRPPRPLGAPPDPDTFYAMRIADATIDLTPGVPDLARFPRAAWLRAERVVLRDAPAGMLGYGDPRGALPLRTAVAEWVARYRGIRVAPDDVVIVAGVAQALGLLARVLPVHGIRDIAVEDPGSLGTRQVIQEWGMTATPVAVDDEGVQVSRLVASGLPALLATPAHQFPLGVVLSGSRRHELGSWLRDGGLLLEDDYDSEHRYDRPPVPALASVVPQRVCYAGSVSKVLAPALRIGWLIVPAGIRADVIAAKRLVDLGNAVLPQLVLAHLMESGVLERHLRAVRRRHRARRDAMVDAVARHLPCARVHGAAAGLHLTVTTPGVDDAAVASAALDHGVKVQPLSWHRVAPGEPGLVLGYAARTASEIEDGVAVLARCVRAARAG